MILRFGPREEKTLAVSQGLKIWEGEGKRNVLKGHLSSALFVLSLFAIFQLSSVCLEKKESERGKENEEKKDFPFLSPRRRKRKETEEIYASNVRIGN